MHIALDVSSAVRPEATGVGIYIRSLVAALARQGTPDRFRLVHRFSRLREFRRFLDPPAPNFTRKLMLGWHPFFGRQVDVLRAYR